MSKKPKVGTIVAGRYELTEQIGEGGMATVFRAHQLGVGRDVAVKVLHSTQGKEAGTVTRLFFREARSVCQLTHPNTITLFDFGKTSEDRLFMVTELIGGRPLLKLIGEGSLTLEAILSIFLQVTGSLLEAHTNGIIHRDLKPDNMLIRETVWEPHFVKVLDFGIVRLMGGAVETTNPALRFGTPLYISPEQILGMESDARTDIYALGVALYECLCGKPPFIAATAVDTCIKHLEQPVPDLNKSGARYQVPPRLHSLLRAMLAKAPPDRPQSVQTVRHELAAILAVHRGDRQADRRSPGSNRKGQGGRISQGADRLASAQSIDLTGSLSEMEERYADITLSGKRGEPVFSKPQEALAPTPSWKERDPQDDITHIVPLADVLDPALVAATRRAASSRHRGQTSASVPVDVLPASEALGFAVPVPTADRAKRDLSTLLWSALAVAMLAATAWFIWLGWIR